MSTFTSGVALHRDLDPIRSRVGCMEAGDPGLVTAAEEIRQVNDKHEQAGRINPILNLFHAFTFGGDQGLPKRADEFLAELAGHSINAEVHLHFGYAYADAEAALNRRGITDAAVIANTFQQYVDHAVAVLTRLRAPAA